MGFSRQEYWNGLPFSILGDLPSPGIEPLSPALAGGFFTGDLLGKPQTLVALVFHKLAQKSGFNKINSQHKKIVIFLYSSDEQYENEINKAAPFTIPSKRTKYLGINLTKEVYNL